jgi:branched-chain amino acid transport system ATP-binding protein
MAEQGAAGLAVEEVTVGFGGLIALDGVSLEAGPGEVVGVIGPNGAGKTTLFNVLCGFVRPNSGTISIGGRRLRHIQPHQLTKLGLARTLQGVGLFAGLSLVDNVVLGAQRSVKADFVSAALGLWWSSREELRLKAEAMALLEQLEIDRYANWYPGALPYGIQKRASLARALMARPTMLLLDEPASGLSGDDMAALGAELRRLRADMGILLVEHHMDLVMSTCDRLVVLNFGRLIAAGTPEEIRANPEVTTAYLGEAVPEPGAGAMEGDGRA